MSPRIFPFRLVLALTVILGPSSLQAHPFLFPRPQYGCIGGVGEIHVLQLLGVLRLGTAEFPVTLHFAAVSALKTGVLPGRWICPMTDSYCLEQDTGRMVALFPDGSKLVFDKRSGSFLQQGNIIGSAGEPMNWTLVRHEGTSITFRNDDGTVVHFEDGRIDRAEIPGIGPLQWRRTGKTIAVWRDSTLLLELSREGPVITATISGTHATVTLENEQSMTVKRADGSSFTSKVTKPDLSSPLANLRIVEEGGTDTTYTFDELDGTLKSDGTYSYRIMRAVRGSSQVVVGLLRSDAQGRTEGSYFNDDLGTNEVFHFDGRHYRYYLSFSPGPLFGKVRKASRIEGDKESVLWQKEFDGQGRVIFCRDEDRRSFTYRYETRQLYPRKVIVRHPKGERSSYEYDSAGRLARRTENQDEIRYRYMGAASLVAAATRGTEVIYDAKPN